MGRRPRRREADAHHSACRRRSIFLAGIGTDPSYIPGHPVAEEPTRSAGGAVRPGSGLTIEGRDLLIALKLFAVSPVHSVNNQQEERLRLASESRCYIVHCKLSIVPGALKFYEGNLIVYERFAKGGRLLTCI